MTVHQGLDHALALAALGIPVFPCRDKDVVDKTGEVDPKKLAKTPLTPHGFKDATTDLARIKALWTGRDKLAFVGYPTGSPSGIVVIDVDMSTLKGKDGWHALDADGLDPSAESNLTYSTMNGGDHYLFAYPSGGDRIGNAQDLLTPTGKLVDVDRRAEGGYAIWYGQAPTSLPPLQPLPAWASVASHIVAGNEFNGTALEWMESLPKGTMTPKASRAVGRIPKEFTYTQMVKLQYSLIMLGAEGEPGIAGALETLRYAWLQDPWNTPKNQARFARALVDGIRKFGGASKAKRAYFGEGGGLNVIDLAQDIRHELALGEDQQIWSYENGVWRPQDSILVKRTVALLGNSYRATQDKTVRNAVLSLGLQNLPEVPDPSLINLSNTMYNWRTGTATAHDPSYLSTVQLPIAYDSKAGCPQFDAWVEQTVPADSIQLLWELIGYMLMSGNPLQKAVLLIGPRGSGKSTLLRLLKALLGKPNVSSTSFAQLTTDKFSVAQLYGKTANLSGDNASSYLEDSSIFKQLTGEDTVQAARKYGHPFDFPCWATMVFSANEFWASKDLTDSYYERWLIVPFPNRVMGTRPLNEAALHAEAAGIFNKAMQALNTLMSRGSFDVSITSADAVDKFKEESDSVRRWLKSDRLLTADPHDATVRTSREAVISSFRDWCNAEGIHRQPSNREIYKRLTSMDYNTEAKSNSNRYVVGINLNKTPPPGIDWLAAANAAATVH